MLFIYFYHIILHNDIWMISICIGANANLYPYNTSNIIEYQRKRGPTKCIVDLTTIDNVMINCNLNGQPIGENSVRFTSYLGVTMREFVPITYKNWKVVL